MQLLNFDYRDILIAPRLGWSVRKLWVSFIGILIAWGVYLVFAYIAIYITPVGKNTEIRILFRHFEFFPTIIPADPGISAWIIWGIGIALALCILLITAVSVARIAFEDLRGNDVYQVKEALQFARTYGLTGIISMIVLVLLCMIFPVTIGVVGVIGRIPYVGELLLAVLSLPLFLWGLLGISVFMVFLFGTVLIPSITACMGEDVLEIIIQTFSSVFLQPLRLICYEIVSKVVITVSSSILILISFITLNTMYVILGVFMGSTFNEILTISLYRLPYVMESYTMVNAIIEWGEIVQIPYIVDIEMVCPTVKVAGWIFGISQLIIFTWILSYFFCSFLSSQVLIFIAIRKHKNGDDLRLKGPITQFVPESPKNNLNNSKT